MRFVHQTYWETYDPADAKRPRISTSFRPVVLDTRLGVSVKNGGELVTVVKSYSWDIGKGVFEGGL